MSEQPIINSVPGFESDTTQAEGPSRQRVPIDNPGPQTRRTAIGSPDAPVYGPNVQGGPVNGEAGQASVVASETRALGETAVVDSGLIDSVPGMEHVPATEPTKKPVVIDNPGPQTLRTAIGSPHAPVYGPNVHGGPTVN